MMEGLLMVVKYGYFKNRQIYDIGLLIYGIFLIIWFGNIQYNISILSLMKFKAIKQKIYSYKPKQQSIINSLHQQQSLSFLQETDSQGNTPIHHSVINNHFNLLKAYIDFVQTFLSRNNHSSNQEMFVSQDKINFKIMYLLNISNQSGITPLHYAAFYGHLKITKYLQQKGAKVHLVTCNGLNVLHFASQSNQPKIFLHFINKLDHNKCDNQGNSILHWACYNKCKEMVDLILEHNLEIDMPNNMGNTALHLAAKFSTVEIVHKLLIHRANRLLINSDRKTPIDLALNYNTPEVHNVLTARKKCSKQFQYSVPEKKNKVFLYSIPLVLQAILLLNLILMGNCYQIRYYFTTAILIFIFSLLILSLFICLTGAFENSNFQESLIIDSIKDITKFCFHCNQQKNTDTYHCYICRKCTKGHYKHSFILDNCLGQENIKGYLLLNASVILLIGACLVYSLVFFFKESNLLEVSIIILVCNQFLVFGACGNQIKKIVSFWRKPNLKFQTSSSTITNEQFMNENDLLEIIEKRRQKRKKKKGLIEPLLAKNNMLIEEQDL